MQNKEVKVTNEQLFHRMQQLVQTFGIQEDFDLGEISDLYAKQKYTECILILKRFLKVPFDLKVGYVNSGGDKNKTVWITIPDDLHIALLHHGVGFCNQHRPIVIYLRRSFFIGNLSIETFVYAIAHEIAHVILYAQAHPLRYSEVATDLTAAIHGFSSIMYIGRKHEKYSFPNRGCEVSCRSTIYGYLSDDQAQQVHLHVSLLQVEQDVHGGVIVDVKTPRKSF